MLISKNPFRTQLRLGLPGSEVKFVPTTHGLRCSSIFGLGFIVPLMVDRLWGIWGSYYTIPKAIFYLLRGDCRVVIVLGEGSYCSTEKGTTYEPQGLAFFYSVLICSQNSRRCPTHPLSCTPENPLQQFLPAATLTPKSYRP